MERPTPTRIILTLLLLLGLYGCMLPLWLSVDRAYGAMIAKAATRVTLPLTGLKATVGLREGENIQFNYVVPDPRNGGVARVPQRLLNGPELPLALAAAFAILALPIRRRALLALILASVVVVAHVVMVTISAHRAAAIVAQSTLPLVQVNERLSAELNAMNRVSDFAAPVVLMLAGLGAWLLRPRSEPPSAG